MRTEDSMPTNTVASALPRGPHALPTDDREEGLDDAGWFVTASSGARRPSQRPKSVPPTGDSDIDGWLR